MLFTVDIARHSVIMHSFAHIFIIVVYYNYKYDISAILLMVKSVV